MAAKTRPGLVDCSRAKLSRHALSVLRMGKRDERLYFVDLEVGIILVDFFQRRIKLSILRDGTSRDRALDPFNKSTGSPIDSGL